MGEQDDPDAAAPGVVRSAFLEAVRQGGAVDAHTRGFDGVRDLVHANRVHIERDVDVTGRAGNAPEPVRECAAQCVVDPARLEFAGDVRGECLWRSLGWHRRHRLVRACRRRRASAFRVLSGRRSSSAYIRAMCSGV